MSTKEIKETKEAKEKVVEKKAVEKEVVKETKETKETKEITQESVIITKNAYLLINFEGSQVDELECPLKITYPMDFGGFLCTISGYQNKKLVEYVLPHNRYYLEIRYMDEEES